MRKYHQYKFENFFQLRFYEGGLTTDQVSAMYKSIVEEQNEDIRFQAALRGVTLKDGGNESPSNSKQTKSEPVVPLFGDPDSYNHLSDEERNVLTQKMMAKHRNWVQNMHMNG